MTLESRINVTYSQILEAQSGVEDLIEALEAKPELTPSEENQIRQIREMLREMHETFPEEY